MQKIETLPLNIKHIPQSFGPLSDPQKIYLKHLQEGMTIAGVVEHMLSHGRLVSFGQLFDLVLKLDKANLVGQPLVRAYFEKIEKHEKPAQGPGIGKLVPSLFKKEEKAETFLSRHPFFRKQNPLILSLFNRFAEVIEAPVGTVLCRAGHIQRELFFLVDGEAAIYKNTDEQGRRLIGFFGTDAIIGEVGFFMGEVRTADVVVTKPAKLVRVQYDEQSFSAVINREVAKKLQVRFRVIHALARSSFLKALPEEALEPLIFVGQMRQAEEFQVICKEGDTGDSCYVVINGSVTVSKGPKTIGVLGPGEAFGEIALFFTQGLRTATVMAQRETTLLELNAQGFYKLLGENMLLAREFEKLALQRSEKLKAS